MNDAKLWERGANDSVICNLCARRCHIGSGLSGTCGVRVNSGGTLKTPLYGSVIAENVDPIEKKPLYHFFPGSHTYSIALSGCNFKCEFCQNFTISQATGLRKSDIYKQGAVTAPKEIVERAWKRKCDSISFTYTEPTVYFEYALDTAVIAKEAELKTVLVSNGYQTPESLSMIAPYIDACNIDLKSFNNDFYKTYCGASLEPVLNTLKAVRAANIWLEITTLIITGLNDSDAELESIADFIAGEIGVDTPWHVSKFFPQYKMTDRSETPMSSIKRAVKIGRAAGLKYVYAGNVSIGQDTDTICPNPKCGKTLITRRGYHTVNVNGLATNPNQNQSQSSCRNCGENISGVFG